MNGSDAVNLNGHSSEDGLTKLVRDVEKLCREGTSQVDTITSKLDSYLEEDYLLDPYIEAILSPCLKTLNLWLSDLYSSNDFDLRVVQDAHIQALYKIIYTLTKVRSYKIIAQFLPHSVYDLQPVLTFLEKSRQCGTQLSWEMTYVMLLQLSIDVLIPFNLDATGKDTMERLFDLAKYHLKSPGLERDAAAVIVARILLRKCENGVRLADFLHWSLAQINTSASKVFIAVGSLQAIAICLKASTYTHLETDISEIQDFVEDVVGLEQLAQNILIKKYRMKIYTRLACLMLPQHPQRLIEDALDLLLENLRDEDTIVRFSASKGLARVAARLEPANQSRVILAIVELFEENTIPSRTNLKSIADREISGVSDYTWHGACLAIAESARRRLLRPEHFAQLPYWLIRALHLDIRRGAASSSDSVRDAACYAMWSFARYLSAKLFKPHAKLFGQSLLITALLDKECHVRRAAAAAFQEHVGRHGLFPHGIEVITKMDFFTVGLLRNSMLEVAPLIGDFQEYRESLLEHLSHITTSSWDPNMRILGAGAIQRFLGRAIDVQRERKIIAQEKLKLLPKLDLDQVHGAILTLTALWLAPTREETTEDFELEGLLNKIDSQLLTISASVPLHVAICGYIKARCQCVDHGTSSEFESLFDYAQKALERKERECQLAAAEAMESLSRRLSFGPKAENILSKASGPERPASRGQILVLGYIFGSQSLAWQKKALKTLLSTSDHTVARPKSADSRKNALDAICHIIMTSSQDEKGGEILSQSAKMIEKALHRSLNDYSIDYRGDIGSQCRSAGLACLQGLYTSRAIALRLTSVTGTVDFLGQCLKQIVEPLDRIRKQAVETLLAILRDAREAKSLQDQDILVLCETFTESAEQYEQAQLFDIVTPLLRNSTWRSYVLGGLSKTLSGKTEASLHHATSALVGLLAFLPMVDEHAYSIVCLLQDIMALGRPFLSNSAEFLPCLEMLRLVLASKSIPELSLADPDLIRGIIRLVSSGLSKINQVARLKTTTSIICLLAASVEERALRDLVLDALSKLLRHRFPMIRIYAVEQLLGAYLKAGRDSTELQKAIAQSDWTAEAHAEASTERILGSMQGS